MRLPIEPSHQKWREVFAGFSAEATLIKASDEDIAALFGADEEATYREACFDAGAQLVCVTRGTEGASVYLPDGAEVTVVAPVTTVVDTVGAGDTFQAAVLHWLQQHGNIDSHGSLAGDVDIEGMAKFAVRAAAVTCSRRGADLPYLSDL